MLCSVSLIMTCFLIKIYQAEIYTGGLAGERESKTLYLMIRVVIHRRRRQERRLSGSGSTIRDRLSGRVGLHRNRYINGPRASAVTASLIQSDLG